MKGKISSVVNDLFNRNILWKNNMNTTTDGALTRIKMRLKTN